LKNDWGVQYITSVETPTLNEGTVVINPDGTLTYTPPPNFVGTDSFTYAVYYTEGGHGDAKVTVTVTDEASHSHEQLNLSNEDDEDNEDKSDKPHKKKKKRG